MDSTNVFRHDPDVVPKFVRKRRVASAPCLLLFHTSRLSLRWHRAHQDKLSQRIAFLNGLWCRFVCIASALSLDTRGARWEEFSREKENYRQRSVQQQFNNGDFLERVGTVRD
jgi:hypothetical protein